MAHNGSIVRSLHIPQSQRPCPNPPIGWAYSGGGRWPERVEVSSGGGYVWYGIALENLSPKHKFAWRTWSGEENDKTWLSMEPRDVDD